MGNAEIVEVLLSTYNGQRYLGEQLESIESQTLNGVFLRIRDDGSIDGTVSALEDYSSERDWVSFHPGKNIGVIGSFMWLLESVSDATEWAAFCDQDDVWDRDKLERAVASLKDYPSEVPAMYFSAVRLVDESRTVIGRSSPCRGSVGFLNALTQNVATGCTIVLNRAAIDLLANRNVDVANIGMHDRWAYLVVSACGEVVCDPEPSMDYRQHADNVVGSRIGLERWNTRLSRFRVRSRTQLVDYAKELIRVYGDDLPPENKRVCEEFIERAGASSALGRFQYAWRAPVFRQNRLDDGLMRVMIALGWR